MSIRLARRPHGWCSLSASYPPAAAVHAAPAPAFSASSSAFLPPGVPSLRAAAAGQSSLLQPRVGARVPAGVLRFCPGQNTVHSPLHQPHISAHLPGALQLCPGAKHCSSPWDPSPLSRSKHAAVLCLLSRSKHASVPVQTRRVLCLYPGPNTPLSPVQTRRCSSPLSRPNTPRPVQTRRCPASVPVQTRRCPLPLSRSKHALVLRLCPGLNTPLSRRCPSPLSRSKHAAVPPLSRSKHAAVLPLSRAAHRSSRRCPSPLFPRLLSTSSLKLSILSLSSALHHPSLLLSSFSRRERESIFLLGLRKHSIHTSLAPGVFLEKDKRPQLDGFCPKASGLHMNSS
ncbi:hypothetical protein WMY93_033208 [Mugilogobius chulae]|uniref:Uncharacterized protein n=1 Tax=Mugilogobius chulae TaxID=88201 RepID=A0AAW0MKS4_9GOBI